MNDLEKIYERLKKSFLEKGYKEEDISESKLRQQAWVNMDREIRKKERIYSTGSIKPKDDEV